jgi:hypothetical protein
MEEPMAKPRTRHEWREIIADYRSSGLRAVEYAKSHTLNIQPFRYWMHTLSVVDELSHPAFVELKPFSSMTTQPLSVALPNHVRIEVPCGTNPHQVRELVDALL